MWSQNCGNFVTAHNFINNLDYKYTKDGCFCFFVAQSILKSLNMRICYLCPNMAGVGIRIFEKNVLLKSKVMDNDHLHLFRVYAI